MTLPTGTTSSGNFFYREAARYALKLDAIRQSVTLGVSLELFRLPRTVAPPFEIVTLMRDAVWTETVAERQHVAQGEDAESGRQPVRMTVIGNAQRPVEGDAQNGIFVCVGKAENEVVCYEFESHRKGFRSAVDR